MSDISKVREMLRLARKSESLKFVHRVIEQVLPLLDRERPEFKAPPTIAPLTDREAAMACRLRAEGWPINRIAGHLGTNIGRVSEAVNGKRAGNGAA